MVRVPKFRSTVLFGVSAMANLLKHFRKHKHKLSRFMNTRMAFFPGFSRLLGHKRLPNQH